jgi:hypothetical protein
MEDISRKTCIVYDRGLYTYMAEFLSRYFGKVQYYRHGSEIYPRGSECQVGKGIPGVEWISDFWGEVDKADIIFFPYVFDGGLQAYLRRRGHKVCGSAYAEKIEHDKYFLKTKLKEVGLPVVPAYRADGLDDLEKYLSDKKGPLAVKSLEPYRGDWETTIYKNQYQFQTYIDHVRQKIGPVRAKEIELLVESWIESECETGCDGFMLDGKMADWPAVGFEIKDEGYIARAVKNLPEIIQSSVDRMTPVYDEMGGYAAPYSNEMRIRKDGKVFRTDETCRCGNPPTTMLIEMYGQQYAQAINELANNRMPKIVKPDYEYGAEIVLQSLWYLKNPLHVGCPKDFGKHLKLNNMYMRNGQRHCDPVLAQDDVPQFGSIVGFGKTLKEATGMAMDKIKEISVYKLSYTENIFDQCEEVVNAGKKWGIHV